MVFEPSQNYYCFHCSRGFIGGRRKGMYDHVKGIDLDQIQMIMITIHHIPESIAKIMSEYTLRNFFIDLSSWSIAQKIIKNKDIEEKT